MSSRAGSDGTEAEPTTFLLEGARVPLRARRFELTVTDGPDSGRTYVSSEARTSIGSDPLNQLVLTDRWVSRFHCEIVVDKFGPRLRDLDSRNGTAVEGLEVRDVYLRDGIVIRIGMSGLK